MRFLAMLRNRHSLTTLQLHMKINYSQLLCISANAFGGTNGRETKLIRDIDKTYRSPCFISLD